MKILDTKIMVELEARLTKSAEVEAPILDVIKNRASKRAYANKAIDPEVVKTLFEAARWAPSSVNEQPWRYLYASNDQTELWLKLLDVLHESNRVWAQQAPLLILSMARKNYLRNNRPNSTAVYDLGAANAFLTLQATALGLNVHQMGGYDREKAKASLNISDEYDLGVIMAIGYPGNPHELPAHLIQREHLPRERFVQTEFARNEAF